MARNKTKYYNFDFLKRGQEYSAGIEETRFQTLNSVLQESFSLLGNGIVYGFDAYVQDSKVVIPYGRAIVNGFPVESSFEIKKEKNVNKKDRIIEKIVHNDSTYFKIDKGMSFELEEFGKYYVYGEFDEGSDRLTPLLDTYPKIDLNEYLNFNTSGLEAITASYRKLVEDYTSNVGKINNYIWFLDSGSNFLILSVRLSKDSPIGSNKVLICEIINDSSGIHVKNSEKRIRYLSDLLERQFSTLSIGHSHESNKINLETDVVGKLDRSLIPGIDASLISSGVINNNRLPSFTHGEIGRINFSSKKIHLEKDGGGFYSGKIDKPISPCVYNVIDVNDGGFYLYTSHGFINIFLREKFVLFNHKSKDILVCGEKLTDVLSEFKNLIFNSKSDINYEIEKIEIKMSGKNSSFLQLDNDMALMKINKDDYLSFSCDGVNPGSIRAYFSGSNVYISGEFGLIKHMLPYQCKKIFFIRQRGEDLWVGTNYGIFVFEKKNDYMIYGHVNDFCIDIYDLCETKFGTYLATNEGVFILETKKFVSNVISKNMLSNGESVFAVGSSYVYKFKNGFLVSSFNRLDGISSKYFYGIDNIFVSTKNGLFVLIGNKYMKIYGNMMFSSTEINGKLYFGGQGEIIEVNSKLEASLVFKFRNGFSSSVYDGDTDITVNSKITVVENSFKVALDDCDKDFVSLAIDDGIYYADKKFLSDIKRDFSFYLNGEENDQYFKDNFQTSLGCIDAKRSLDVIMVRFNTIRVCNHGLNIGDHIFNHKSSYMVTKIDGNLIYVDRPIVEKEFDFYTHCDVQNMYILYQDNFSGKISHRVIDRKIKTIKDGFYNE